MPDGADNPAAPAPAAEAQRQPVFNILQLDNSVESYRKMVRLKNYLGENLQNCQDPDILKLYNSINRGDEIRDIKSQCEAKLAERLRNNPGFVGSRLYGYLTSAIGRCEQLLGLLAAGADRAANLA